MSEDTVVIVAVAAVPLVHLAVLVWAPSSRDVRPVLVVNLLFAMAELVFIGPEVPHEIAYIQSSAARDFLDYKATLWSSFELAVLIASTAAYWGAPPAKILAWIGFAGNFVLSLLAVALALLLAFSSFAWH